MEDKKDRMFARAAIKLNMITEEEVDIGKKVQKTQNPPQPLHKVLESEGLLTARQVKRIFEKIKAAQKIDTSEEQVEGAATNNVPDIQVVSGGTLEGQSRGTTMELVFNFLNKQTAGIPRMLSKKEKSTLSGAAKGLELHLPKEKKDKWCGKKARDYLLLRRLEKSPMGTVYRAQQTKLGRIVALKILSEQHSEDSAFSDSFMEKATSATNINHPNMLQVYDAGEFKQRFFVAMEFIAGDTVKNILERMESIPQINTVQIGIDIAKALVEMHRHHIVHGNITTENIIVTTQGIGKLADLGWLKRSEKMETPYYIAPERITNPKEVDHRADIYSLGMCLYHMLTGTTPFYNEETKIVLQGAIKKKLPPVDKVNSNVIPSLGKLINRMTEKNPEDRYQTPEDILGRLEKIFRDIQDSKEQAPVEKEVEEKQPDKEMAPKVRKPREKDRTPPPSKTSPTVIFLLLLIAGGAIATSYILFFKEKKQPVKIIKKKVPTPAEIRSQKYRVLNKEIEKAAQGSNVQQWKSGLTKVQAFCSTYQGTFEAEQLAKYKKVFTQKIAFEEALQKYNKIERRTQKLLKKAAFLQAQNFIAKAKPFAMENFRDKMQKLAKEITSTAEKHYADDIARAEKWQQKKLWKRATAHLQNSKKNQLPQYAEQLEKEIQKIQNSLRNTSRFQWICQTQDKLYPLLIERNFDEAKTYLNKIELYASKDNRADLSEFGREMAILEKLDRILFSTLEKNFTDQNFRFVFSKEAPFTGKIVMVSRKKRNLMIKKINQSVVSRPLDRLSWDSKQEIWQVAMGKSDETSYQMALLPVIQGDFENALREIGEIADPTFTKKLQERLVQVLIRRIQKYATQKNIAQMQLLLHKYQNMYSDSDSWRYLREKVAQSLYRIAQRDRKVSTAFHKLIIEHFAGTSYYNIVKKN